MYGVGLGEEVAGREEVRGYVEAAVALLQLYHVALREVQRDLRNGDVVAGRGPGPAARWRAGSGPAGRGARLTTDRPGPLSIKKIGKESVKSRADLFGVGNGLGFSKPETELGSDSNFKISAL